jgi:tol-pal system protein YbgF
MLRRLALCVFLIAAAPALAQDAADAIVRLNRLENQVRQLSGQIEQLQHENRQLKEQARRFQEDVEFRFQDGRGAAARPSPPSATSGQNPSAAAPARPVQQPSPLPQRRGDAFDPRESPDAPGAPRPLGATAPSAPLASAGAGGPMRLPAPLYLGRTSRSPASPAPAAVPRAGPSIAATGSPDPRADYDAAYALLVQRQYEQAEMGFRRFIQSHPRDRMVPEAMYWLGESYLQRNRAREAAEQFLNLSTEHPNAGKAPDALLKLGVSLNALGARDRACAVYGEFDRKYPQAAPALRQGLEREQKRAKCV